jgi:hypothetical protein
VARPIHLPSYFQGHFVFWCPFNTNNYIYLIYWLMKDWKGGIVILGWLLHWVMGITALRLMMLKDWQGHTISPSVMTQVGVASILSVFDWLLNLAFCLSGLSMSCLVAWAAPRARLYLACRTVRARPKWNTMLLFLLEWFIHVTFPSSLPFSSAAVHSARWCSPAHPPRQWWSSACPRQSPL